MASSLLQLVPYRELSQLFMCLVQRLYGVTQLHGVPKVGLQLVVLVEGRIRGLLLHDHGWHAFLCTDANTPLAVLLVARTQQQPQRAESHPATLLVVAGYQAEAEARSVWRQ